jgi:acetyl-CoA synthetase
VGPSATAPRPVLRKNVGDFAVEPNLVDYDECRARFSWEAARRALDGLPGGGLNIAHEAVDRHAVGSRRDHPALRFLRADGSTEEFTYSRLARETNRFANVLRGLGVRAAGRVFSLAGRIPELYVAALGSLKAGATFCPLFSAFGPEPIRTRLEIGEASVLVTTEALYRKKIEPMRGALPNLEHVLLVGEAGRPVRVAGAFDLRERLAAASDRFAIAPTDPESIALLHFTSGTTGRPKGAIHAHEAAVAHHATGMLALDLHRADVFWCTADPGWVTGTSYGIVSPLTHGVTVVVDECEFDVERWFRILREQRVSVWYTAPTAIRMTMKMGVEPGSTRGLERLRFVASVGEPLNPEAVLFGVEAFGMPIHDNWWQTETGGIMIANFLAMDVKPGSMGKPLPGVEAAVVERGEDGRVRPAAAGAQGELALRPGWPSMFRGYLHEEERYRRCFQDGWYLTGDLARRDEDGYFWFVGRADDVIKSAGHLVGPFEVESALMEHPAVAEAAVIGKPDPVVHEVVKAFVSLKAGFAADEATRRDLLAFSRRRLGPVVAPKEIDVLPVLPRTRSGKILRRLLKARELGLPEGDTSTLEAGA